MNEINPQVLPITEKMFYVGDGTIDRCIGLLISGCPGDYVSLPILEAGFVLQNIIPEDGILVREIREDSTDFGIIESSFRENGLDIREECRKVGCPFVEKSKTKLEEIYA